MTERQLNTSSEMDAVLEEMYETGEMQITPRQLKHRAGLLIDYLDGQPVDPADVLVKDESSSEANRLVEQTRVERTE